MMDKRNESEEAGAIEKAKETSPSTTDEGQRSEEHPGNRGEVESNLFERTRRDIRRAWKEYRDVAQREEQRREQIRADTEELVREIADEGTQREAKMNDEHRERMQRLQQLEKDLRTATEQGNIEAVQSIMASMLEIERS